MSKNAKKTATSLPPDDRLFSRKQAMDYLTVGEATLDRRIKDGTIPVIPFGRRILIRKSAIDAALAEK